MAWIWLTREMFESDSWQALPLGARKVIDRVMLEHMAHGGTRNGELTVTYDDFAKVHLSSRRATAQAIRIAVALGFIDITTRGRRAYGIARVASRYGLTWLPRCDGTPATNRWRHVTSREAAMAMVRALAGGSNMPVEARPATERGGRCVTTGTWASRA